MLAKEGLSDLTRITDGCSKFMIEVFGDSGAHTRGTEGMAAMPLDVTFEADILVELQP